MHPALRLLPLPLSIALCLPAMAADKPVNYGLCPIGDAIGPFNEAPAVPSQPAVPREQQPTDISGDQLSGTDTNPQYDGAVRIQRGDQYLGTDSLVFDKETENYVANGNVQYQDTGIRIAADRAEGNQGEDTHKISNVQYQLVDRRGNGAADFIDLAGAKGELHQSTYSTCDPKQRLWELRAREIDVDSDEGFGVAKNAVLHIGKVPVLYVPWVKFPIDDRRRTGLLFPAIGSSSRNGFDYTQPIYLNLAPNYDATLAPRIMTNRGFALDSEFRYLYDGGRGTIDGLYMPSDDLRDGDSRGRFRFDGYHNIDSHWQARANLGWVSDDRFTEDFSSSLNGVSTSLITSTLGVYGTGDGWSVGAMADHWQSSDYTLVDDQLPYDRLPRVYANWEKNFGSVFEAGVYSEAVRFDHPSKPGGARFDVKPYVSMDLQGPSWFVKPTLAYRYTAYQLENELALQLANPGRDLGAAPDPANPLVRGDTSPTRALPIVTLDAGLFFDRDASWGDDDYLQTLEPRLFYLNAPYREQNDLPIFDTRPFTFSWGQLFRDNRFTGADRQTDANQLTLALSTRMIRQATGLEKFSASLGQILYFDDSRVTDSQCFEDPNTPGLDCVGVEHGKSAWIVDANYAPTDRWTIGATYQWDPKFRREDLASLRARYLLPDDGVINIGYRYRRDLLEQADFNFLYPISQVWSIVGRYYYSIEESKPLEQIAGVQWDSCCLAVRAMVRRYVRNRDGDLNSAIQFEFELKGLGSAGQDTERTLRRAILGYYRDDLYLVPPSNTTFNRDDYDPNLIP